MRRRTFPPKGTSRVHCFIKTLTPEKRIPAGQKGKAQCPAEQEGHSASPGSLRELRGPPGPDAPHAQRERAASLLRPRRGRAARHRAPTPPHCPERPASRQLSRALCLASPRAPVTAMGTRSTPLGPASHGHGSGKPRPQPPPPSSCFQPWGSPMGLLDAHQAPRAGWGECGPMGSGGWAPGEVRPRRPLGQPVLRGSREASQKVPARRSTRRLKRSRRGHTPLF